METCPLGSVVDVSAGQPAPKANAFSASGKSFIRAGSLENLLNGGSLADCEKVSDAEARRNRLKLYPKDTIVFAKSGMSATLGRVFRLTEPAYAVSHLAILIPTGRYDPIYLTHWLRRNPPSHLIKDPAYPSIRVSDIESVRVPYLPISEQKRIATILDKADGIARKGERALAVTEELIRAAFRDMFGDPASNPNHYPTLRLESLLSIPLRNGISPSRRGRVSAPLLTLSAITGGAFDPTQQKMGMFLVAIAPKDEVDARDFYICRGNGSPELVGRGFYATQSMAGVAFPDTMIAARPRVDILSPAYLETIWNGPFIRSQIVNAARTTNGTYKVNQTAVGNITFPVPPIDLQLQFQRLVEKVRSIQRSFLSQRGNGLLGSLSQQAFRGEL